MPLFPNEYPILLETIFIKVAPYDRGIQHIVISPIIAHTPKFHDNPFSKSKFLSFGLVFLLILILKGTKVTQPPVWDTAFAVYTSALEISAKGFDLAAIRQMPSYWEGGGSVHAGSLVTLITATILSVIKTPPSSFVVLHLLHFAVAAMGLVVFWRLAARAIGFLPAAGLSAAALLQPAFSTQTGYMYTEIPTFACGMLAISAWANRKFAWAFFWLFITAWIKQSGLIAAVALAVASMIEEQPFRTRLQRATLMLSAALPGLVFASLFHLKDRGFLHFERIGQWSKLLVFNFHRYLLTVPDLLILILASVIIALLKLRDFRKKCEKRKNGGMYLDNEALAERFRITAILFIAAFLGFYYVAMPVFADYFQVLIRYNVVVIPLMLFLLVDALQNRFGRRFSVGLIVGMCFLFACNYRGVLYPDIPARFGNDFSIAERSGEYIDLLKLQRKAIDRITKLGETPVFYELPVYYLTARPELGYVDKPLKNGYCIFFEEPYRQARLVDFPPCFYMLYLSPWLGGGNVRRIEVLAYVNPSYEVKTAERFVSGPFIGRLIRVRRIGNRCP